MAYTDQQMVQLAQRYLANVGYHIHIMSPRQVIAKCVSVYNERKAQGLEQ